jgi:DNA mismatch repair protein MutS
MALVKEYFALHKKYSQEYGDKTMILMQVGAFFEVYGLKDETGIITESNIETFSQLCDLVMANKKSTVNGKDVLMSGFRDYMLDKYLKRLQENGCTSVVFTQDTPSKNTTRSLSAIYSPGTFFSSDAQTMSNNTTCVWLMETKGHMHIGIANVDIYTGKTAVFEFHVPSYHNPTAYDELERYLSIYDPAEVLLVYPFDKPKMDEIVGFVGASQRCLHYVSNCHAGEGKLNHLQELANRCEKQPYQQEILGRFNLVAEDSNVGLFAEHALCTQSLCFLLDYVYRHNPDLVNRLEKPVFENNTSRMVLANHSLKQLNMIDDAQYTGKLSSVVRFLNNCTTVMGKRRFHYKLLNPITDIASLNRCYELTDYILNISPFDSYRAKLRDIRDLEKLERKRILKRVTPYDFYTLHQNLGIVSSLLQDINQDQTLVGMLTHTTGLTVTTETLDLHCQEIASFLEANLTLDKCKELDTLHFDKSTVSDESTVAVNFVKPGVSAAVDDKVRNSFESRDKLECIRAVLNDFVKYYEKKTSTTEYVKIHETPALGVSLTTTKRRSAILDKTNFGGELTPGKEYYAEYTSRYDGKVNGLSIHLLDIRSHDATSSTVSLSSAQIRGLCSQVRTSKEALVDAVTSFYRDFIQQFECYAEKVLEIAQFVTWLDVYCCQAYNAKKYNYSRPIVAEGSEKAFVKTEGLRHCLIEHLQTRELYVTNDISLGGSESDSLDGILLYGTNAVGKTSLIRALGISVILAQSGMFVPATQMVFSPYHYLFTRILGNDNLFKGMSTFAVEMSELRTILQLSDANSLTLGDELCSGTESDSALSIFTAGLEKLAGERSSFLFATHFHELANYDEVKQLDNVGMRHMSVRYDKVTGKLVYDRKLKDGPGDSMYGLEVCKALQLPDDFLERAHSIRMKYHPETQSVVDLGSSRYNAKKVIGTCEICGERNAVDVHHLQYQKDACKAGFINNSFHKNHKANLAALCKQCHQDIHAKNTVYRRVKTTDGYQLEAQ